MTQRFCNFLGQTLNRWNQFYVSVLQHKENRKHKKKLQKRMNYCLTTVPNTIQEVPYIFQAKYPHQ